MSANREPFLIVVETTDIATGETRYDVIDYAWHSDAVWLSKHSCWALKNGHAVTTYPGSEPKALPAMEEALKAISGLRAWMPPAGDPDVTGAMRAADAVVAASSAERWVRRSGPAQRALRQQSETAHAEQAA